MTTGTQAPTDAKFLLLFTPPIREQWMMPGNYLQKERIPPHHSRKAGDCWPVDAALGPPMTDRKSGKESSGKLTPSGVRPHQSARWHAVPPLC